MKPSNRWHRAPTVWLILALLGSTMAGSISLVFVAFAHQDELPRAIPRLASPLPPTAAARPADQATP
ncbi:MAG TPA: hypothetical protein VF132_02970 [Rudaea sp.]